MKSAGQGSASLQRARARRDGVAAPGALEVEIVRLNDVWPEDAVEDELLVSAARAAFRAAGAGGACEISVALTGDSGIRTLNRQWRGKDAATNVLSFPLDTPPPPPGHSQPLGDVVLAWETVAREAGEKGVAVAAHAAHLVVHGVLHILGHVHDNDVDAECMEQLETGILSTLGIADPHAGCEPLQVAAEPDCPND